MKVSVLRPVFNRVDFIETAIESALRQTGCDLEVIVVDDASTDGTPEVVKSINDRRVRLLRNESNRGPAAARNTGLDSARGDYILFLDSDDYLLDNALTVYLRELACSPEANVVYGNLLLVDKDGHGVGCRKFPAYADSDLVPAFLYGCVVPMNGALVRLRAINAIGGFDEELFGTEDYDLMARLAPAGHFRHCDKAVYAYRNHADQLCGHANCGIPEMTGLALDRMLKRHALSELFPDCFKNANQSDLAARVRLVTVFDHHGLNGRRDAALDEVMSKLRGSFSKTEFDNDRHGNYSVEALELAKLIWRYRTKTDPVRAKELSKAALRRYPLSPRLWKEWLLARH